MSDRAVPEKRLRIWQTETELPPLLGRTRHGDEMHAGVFHLLLE
jgi:hypothetical protein